MKIITDLLKNKFVKIIGIIFIIYFGLLNNKDNPESLGNRLSKESIKKNINDIEDKTNFITFAIRSSKEVEQGLITEDELKQRLNQNAISTQVKENIDQIVVKDIENGEGEISLECGNYAEISSQTYAVPTMAQLEFIEKETILIGSNKNFLIEQKIIGMKKNAVKEIYIPKTFKSNNIRLSSLLKFNESNLVYKIKLLNIKSEKNKNVDCKI